jgi:two-component system sensor histidine kinase KdpD
MPRSEPHRPRWPSPRWGYAGAVAAVAVATAVDAAMSRWLARLGQPGDLSNLVLVYLLAAVWTASRLGRGPAIVASVGGVVAFDFFFVPPALTFSVTDTQYLITLAVMLAVATVTSTLTDRVRAGAELARRRERRTAALLALSRALASTRDAATVAAAAVAQAAEAFDAAAVVLGPTADTAHPVAAAGPPFEFGPAERSAAAAAVHHAVTATAGTAVFRPLVASGGVVGVLAVRPADDPERDALLEAFAAQTAAALERAQLADEARAAWERVEAEFLRNTLLSSVSHDLRTPLAAIAGTAETLLHTGDRLDAAVRRDLTETVLDESRRLERLIGNLLDVTRLESGGLNLRREWQPVGELVGAALHRMRGRLGDRPVSVDVPPGVPMIRVDAVSFEQVLANLLDNAAEYTPAGSPLEVVARSTDREVTIEVGDRGPGVPIGTEEQVFQKFFRSHVGGGRGTGLGLAICRGIVEAHGGTITVANRDGGGAVFRVTLPVEEEPPSIVN